MLSLGENTGRWDKSYSCKPGVVIGVGRAFAGILSNKRMCTRGSVSPVAITGWIIILLVVLLIHDLCLDTVERTDSVGEAAKMRTSFTHDD